MASAWTIVTRLEKFGNFCAFPVTELWGTWRTQNGWQKHVSTFAIILILPLASFGNEGCSEPLIRQLPIKIQPFGQSLLDRLLGLLFPTLGVSAHLFQVLLYHHPEIGDRTVEPETDWVSLMATDSVQVTWSDSHLLA